MGKKFDSQFQFALIPKYSQYLQSLSGVFSLSRIENKHKNDDQFTKYFWLKLYSKGTRNGVIEL